MNWRRPLTNIDLIKYTKNLRYFRGVFMRDQLPKKSNYYEDGILNLDTSENQGTHWIAYRRRGAKSYVFDPYGDLSPPPELISYLEPSKIHYNFERFQDYNTHYCGHLSVIFLNYKNYKNLIYKKWSTRIL